MKPLPPNVRSVAIAIVLVLTITIGLLWIVSVYRPEKTSELKIVCYCNGEPATESVCNLDCPGWRERIPESP